MDKLKSVLFDRYILTLKHEYEFEKNGEIRRVKADEPLCIGYAVAHIDMIPAPMVINEMMDKLKIALLKQLTAEE